MGKGSGICRFVVRLAFSLPVACLAFAPLSISAADRDSAEIKNGITNLLNQVQTLQLQVGVLRNNVDSATNSLRNEISMVENSVLTLKSAVEARDRSDTPTARQAQFTASLRDLSNTVSQLSTMVADLKAGAGKADYKAEVDRQLSALSTRIAALNNTLASAKPAAMDAETKNNIAYLRDNLAHAGGTPGWVGYTLLGLVAISLGLSGWIMAVFRRKLADAERRTRETREAMSRFGSQMEARVKSMEGSSVAVQTSAKEVTDFLERVEATVHGQLDSVAKKLDASQLTELVGGTARTSEQLGKLRSETAALQKFMGDLQQTTQRWIADFEKQTSHSLDQIKSEMLSLDRLIWPAPFLDGGKLSPAHERIRVRATAGDQAAFALLLALGQLQLAISNRGGDHAPIVEALDRLGTLAYCFWKEEPGTSIETVFETAQEWGAEINKLLTDNNLPINIRVIMPRASFDTTTMLSEHSLSGTTVRVREPLSWAIVHKGQDQQKVLVTGKVITE